MMSDRRIHADDCVCPVCVVPDLSAQVAALTEEVERLRAEAANASAIIGTFTPGGPTYDELVREGDRLAAERDTLRAQLEEARGELEGADAAMAASTKRLVDALGKARDDRKRAERLAAALRGCIEAMEMQEKRETEEFHISRETARHIWDQSKSSARAALSPTSPEPSREQRLEAALREARGYIVKVANREHENGWLNWQELAKRALSALDAALSPASPEPSREQQLEAALREAYPLIAVAHDDAAIYRGKADFLPHLDAWLNKHVEFKGEPFHARFAALSPAAAPMAAARITSPESSDSAGKSAKQRATLPGDTFHLSPAAAPRCPCWPGDYVEDCPEHGRSRDGQCMPAAAAGGGETKRCPYEPGHEPGYYCVACFPAPAQPAPGGGERGISDECGSCEDKAACLRAGRCLNYIVFAPVQPAPGSLWTSRPGELPEGTTLRPSTEPPRQWPHPEPPSSALATADPYRSFDRVCYACGETWRGAHECHVKGWITEPATAEAPEEYKCSHGAGAADSCGHCDAGLPATAEAGGGEAHRHCQASRGDGECFWRECPQLRDNEPARSGRHCPLDTTDDDGGCTDKCKGGRRE